MENNSISSQPDNNKSKNDTLWFFVILFFLISVVEGIVLFYNYENKEDDSSSKNDIAVTNAPTFGLSYTPTPMPIITPAPVLRTEKLDKEYLFPLRDNEGNEVAQINYLIKQYEFTKEVSVNFQKATITNDKIILAFDVELTNDTAIAIHIIARDYLRLSINNEDKWIAPEVHSDPVEVRPHSTKETKVGFTINESDTNIKLQVGELEGEKEIIEIE